MGELGAVRFDSSGNQRTDFEDEVRKRLESIGSVAMSGEYKKQNLLNQIEEVNRFAADSAFRGVTDFPGQMNIEIRANLLASDVASKNNDASLSLILKSQAEVLVALRQYVQ